MVADARRFLLDLLAVALPVVLVVLYFAIPRNDAVIIDPPTVPQALLDRGVTRQFLVQMLQARVSEVQQVAQSSKTPATMSRSDAPQRIDIATLEFPLNVVLPVIDHFAVGGFQRRLTMSVVCDAPDCESDALSLQVVALHNRIVPANPIRLSLQNPAPSIDEAADHLLRTFDPYYLALYRFRMQRHEEARRIAEDMLGTAHPQAIWAHNLLGMLAAEDDRLEATERLREAGRHFDRALLLDPDFAPALANRGRLHIFQGNLIAAAVFLGRAHVIDPNSVGLNTTIGDVKLHHCDWEGAEAAFRRALESEPYYSPALRGLAAVEILRWGDPVTAAGLAKLAEHYGSGPKVEFGSSEELRENFAECDRIAVASVSRPVAVGVWFNSADHP